MRMERQPLPRYAKSMLLHTAGVFLKIASSAVARIGKKSPKLILSPVAIVITKAFDVIFCREQ